MYNRLSSRLHIFYIFSGGIQLKKRLRVIVAILVVLIAFSLVMFFMPFGKTKTFVASDYSYGLDYHKELDYIPVMSQETGYTCYAVSMAIIRNYLGFETTEYKLRSDLNLLERSKGMLPKEYLTYANRTFVPLSFSVSLMNPASQAEILSVISDSLERNLPVVIFYSAKDDWNKPYYNTHYAVIYGIDMKKEKVKISNPYGYLEELSFVEMYGGLNFTTYEAEPFIFRVARKVGIVNNNNIFVFDNTPRQSS